MPYFFRIAERKDPRNPEGQGKYYGIKRSAGRISLVLIAKEIAERAGQSEGTVIGLLEDLHNEMVRLLQLGFKVRFANLGVFSLQIHGTGSATKEDYDPSFMQKIMVRWRPSTDLKTSMSLLNNDVQFVNIMDKLDTGEDESEEPEEPVP